MTTRERVWRMLDEFGPLSTRDLALDLGINAKQAADACFKLCLRGLARKVGKTDGYGCYKAVGEFVPDARRELKHEPAAPCALAEAWGWLPQKVES